MTLLFAMASAVIVAYSMAYLAHNHLGVASFALREQALIGAALIFGLVTIEFLASKE